MDTTLISFFDLVAFLAEYLYDKNKKMATCYECNKKIDAVGFSSNKDKSVIFCE